jgi:hypothetical protein
MKRFQVYRRDASEQDCFAVMDFASVPPDARSDAEHQAYELAYAAAVWEAENLAEVYDRFPLLCGFAPWVWGPSGGWQPGGLSRERFIQAQKEAARMELASLVSTFLQVHGRYMSPTETLEILTDILSNRVS